MCAHHLNALAKLTHYLVELEHHQDRRKSRGTLMAQPRNEWRNWYSHRVHRARRDHQLKVQPLCEFCLKQGKHTPATIAGHIEPHGGDINKFLRGPLRSLSLGCHNKKWSEDRRGFGSAVGLDGYPIDPRHPHNTPSASPLTHDWSDAAMASPPDEEAKPVAVPARATALPSLLARRKRSVTR